MRQNAARRTLLLDSAIHLLAREGARGLSYRALDNAAELPTGTASNYFRNRMELLHQIALHVHERLMPDPQWLEEILQKRTGRELYTALLENLVERVLREQHTSLALLELRLEATRNPELRASLFSTVRHNIGWNQRFSEEHGLALRAEDFVLMYLAISGLLVEELTVPGVLAPYTRTELVQALVARFLPSKTGEGGIR